MLDNNTLQSIFTQTVAFTGRRPKDLLGYSYDPYIPLVQKLQTLILQLCANGATTFISGGAQGFDQLAFQAVDSLQPNMNVQNILYLPCYTQTSQWASQGAFSKAEYARLCGKADAIHVIDSTITKDSPYKEIASAMHKRNHQMVDDCDVLVALVPHNEPLPKGGTFATIQYAKKQKKPIIYIEYQLSKTVDVVDINLELNDALTD